MAVITGNGHARRDHGMPAYLARVAPDLTVYVLGQTEDVRIDATSFAAACRDRPERTVAGDASLHLSSGWFEKLGLIV